MASKEQKRGKEVRKPKKAKGSPAATVSPFVVTQGKTPAGQPKK